jgi:hypothetical protein
MFSLYVLFITLSFRVLYYARVTVNNGWSITSAGGKHSFRIDDLEDLDTISLVGVYESLIHAAIQYKQFPLYRCYQTHIP